jgi:hypothetical protein
MFLKAMNKEGEGFEYLGQKFPSKSETKLKKKLFSSVLKENSFFKTSTSKIN